MSSMVSRLDSASRKEFTTLTAFRGFAALLVVVFHNSGSFLPNLVFTDPHRVLREGLSLGRLLLPAERLCDQPC
ncbi:hypothetical protein [Teichococcus aestuarii]|uniref:hypothetical protein n=1 Tax=Teichococcus aestuarii TaxID=568898 RepID=UPI0015E7FAD6|nr:hypothetical protein [Pseudoroseomonas aestuarii]